MGYFQLQETSTKHKKDLELTGDDDISEGC